MLEGAYRDRLSARDGRVLVDCGWRPNSITLHAWPLVAGLLRNDARFVGVQYCAVGEGNFAWDTAPPAVDVSAATLEREVARVAVGAEQMTYIDGFGSPTELPTSRIEVTVEFRWKQQQTLREFALFGGDADGGADSGRIINHVVHMPLTVSAGQTLTRRVRLSFRPVASRSGASFSDRLTPGSTIGVLPSITIDGVGSKVAAAFEEAKIATIDDVAQLAHGEGVGNLGPTQLIELRAKARLAVRTAARLPMLTPLESMQVRQIMEGAPDDLSNETDLPLEAIQSMQEQLGLLQVALDARKLKKLTLAELRG